MNLYLASTAELYAEHRRTESAKKNLKIAAELQRRHDEQYSRPGLPLSWFCWEGYGSPGTWDGWFEMFRYDFRFLP
jgi:hypothetical protein